MGGSRSPSGEGDTKNGRPGYTRPVSLTNSLRVRGIQGTIQLALLRAFNFNRTPTHILSRMLDLRRYDREHHIETAGLIETKDLKLDTDSKAHGTRYGGATPWMFREILSQIPVDHKKYTFIDVGSGKGVALFLASDYPFRKIIGVEYAPELHEVALRNIRTFRSKTQKCSDISSICMDGGAYEYPDGPWVLFLTRHSDCPSGSAPRNGSAARRVAPRTARAISSI
jgi:hypothetical protein